jgi:hypothetical protein
VKAKALFLLFIAVLLEVEQIFPGSYVGSMNILNLVYSFVSGIWTSCLAQPHTVMLDG